MSNFIEVKTTVNISIDKIKDLLITAIEGGSNYWAKFKLPQNWKSKYKEYYDIPFENGEIEIFDIETDELLGILNIATIQLGLQLMADFRDIKGNHIPTRHFQNILNENYDCETADVFLQLSIMGEIVFG